jgi:hypothetical protein
LLKGLGMIEPLLERRKSIDPKKGWMDSGDEGAE